MARTIAVIQQQMLDSIAADPVLGPALTSTSKRAIYTLFTFIMAVAISIHEQLMDIFTSNVETIAATAAPATPAWLQAQIFKFQYSDVNPQIIQFINGAPTYPVVDPTLRIITQCSVTTTAANIVQIKCAVGTPPGSFASPQIDALKAYVNPPFGIGIAGVTYKITSAPADNLYIAAKIYFSGSYAPVIQATVIAAINLFLSTIPFNGVMKLSDLELAIKSVPGVTDVFFINVQARAFDTTFGSGTSLVAAQIEVARLWDTVSGYIIQETTAGQTFANSLNFIAE